MDKARLKKMAFKVLRYPALIFCVLFATYALSNMPAFYKSTKYFFLSHFWKEKVAEASEGLLVSSEKNDIKLSEISKRQLIPDNNLVIPKIGLTVPILWQINNDEKEIQKSLQDGVVNIAGTSLPGESGNVFITGHSSNYLWANGNFKTAFALLSRLEGNDLIYLKYRGAIYVYRVYDELTVKPNRADLMNSGSKSIISLMTCTPIGTSINRLIIQAEQIYPAITTKGKSKFVPPRYLPNS